MTDAERWELWVQTFAREAYELPEVVAVYRGRGPVARCPSVTVIVGRHTARVHKRVMAVADVPAVRALQPPVCMTSCGGLDATLLGEQLIGRRP